MLHQNFNEEDYAEVLTSTKRIVFKTEKQELAEKKEKREKCNRNRNRKDNFPMFQDGVFNCTPAPWGFNWFLGYCEQSNNFDTN